jgi:pimeloyl-ACP methyl ester carboxylesterase
MIGMSYGGWWTLNYAIHAPKRLKKIILLSPAGSCESISYEMIGRAIFASLPGRYWSDSFMKWLTYKPELLSARKGELLNRMLDQTYVGGKYISAISMINPIVFKDEELRRVKIPTLLLIGEQEVMYDPVPAVKNAKRLMPSITAEIVPKASHTMILTRSELVDQKGKRGSGVALHRPDPA